MKTAAIALCAGMVAVTGLASFARSEPLTLRQQFFKDSKSARLIDGSQQDCCGVGDAVRVKILAQSGGMIAAKVIATMRHPTAKVGELVNVPVIKLARFPTAPSELGTILFMSYSKYPYCLMQQDGF